MVFQSVKSLHSTSELCDNMALNTAWVCALHEVCVHGLLLCLLSPDEELVGETPQRPDSPEFHRGEGAKTPPNLRSLHEEQTEEEDEKLVQ